MVGLHRTLVVRAVYLRVMSAESDEKEGIKHGTGQFQCARNDKAIQGPMWREFCRIEPNYDGMVQYMKSSGKRRLKWIE